MTMKSLAYQAAVNIIYLGYILYPGKPMQHYTLHLSVKKTVVVLF